jgi:inositol-pentakisphosphate 2-kinase
MPTDQVFDYYDQRILPLFGKDQLVEQIKVTISSSLVASCNEILDVLEIDNQRHDKRVGWHLADDDIGLLMTSMASTPNTLKRIEFKPKWLAQSPTAPAGSVRCRTCALSAFRNKKPQSCPLRLTEVESTSTSNFTPPPWIDTSEPAEVTQALNQFFTKGKGHSILQTLKQQQILLDPKGVSNLCISSSTHKNAHPHPSTTLEEISKLSMAMTLRDCTFFVNVSRDGKSEVVIDGRLADLDPKSGDDAKRLGKWYWDERELIEKGWYEGIGDGVGERERVEECWFWKGSDLAKGGKR